jgi:hypothetical protein
MDLRGIKKQNLKIVNRMIQNFRPDNSFLKREHVKDAMTHNPNQ